MDDSDRIPQKSDRDFWASIHVGDFVSLETGKGSMGGDASTAAFHIRDVRRISIKDEESGLAFADYFIHELDTPDGSLLWFVLVSRGDDFELRVYWTAPEFLPGLREQLVNQGRTWLFLPPQDPEIFLPSNLEYAPFPDVPEVEEIAGEPPKKRVFGSAGFGSPVFGSYRRGAEDVPVILMEYGCEEADAPFPLILVLEERWIRPDGIQPEEGGYVSAMIGRKLEPEDVDISPG